MSHPRTYIAAALVTLCLCAPFSAEAGGVLLAVTEVDRSGSAHHWWTSSAAPTWTESDLRLRQELAAGGIPVVDPSVLPSPPPISQIVYGHPHLSTINAINLASLFGANRVIAGEITAAEVSSPLPGEVGVEVRMDLHVFATGSTIELLPIEVSETGYAESADEAELIARDRAFARVRPLIVHTATFEDARLGIPTEEPVLVVTGLRNAAPLVAVKRALKSRKDIDDVLELWAAEGVIAVELNPGVIDTPETVTAAIDDLLRQPFDDFRIVEVARETDRIEVSIEPILAPTAEVPPAPQ